MSPVWLLFLGSALALRSRQLILLSGAHCIAKSPEKPKCGEDGFVLAQSTKGFFILVADGVGGWTTSGIDPSILVWKLLSFARDHFTLGVTLDPFRLLAKAYGALVEDPASSRLSGSTTIVLITADSAGTLRSCLLGDSGFLIIRNRRILYRSTEQQHYFNAPFQLGLNNGSPLTDLPHHSDCKSLSIAHGDIIVTASDGLFDNVFDADILADALKFYDHASQTEEFQSRIYSDEALSRLQKQADATARLLAEKARRLGADQSYRSPFAVGANRAGYQYIGGKLDDVTVVVSLVQFLEDQCFK